MILGIDFAMGVGATLTAEFLIAHAFLWYTRGGSGTVSSALTTIETDFSKVKGGVVTLEQKGLSGVKTLEADAKVAVSRTDQFFHSLLGSNTAAQTAPVSPVAQTAPVAQNTTGTPVPSVVLNSPSK